MTKSHLLTKVISGGQTGADQAGLWTATKFGIKTGGWAPKGWQTKDGPNPGLAKLGLLEHKGGYRPRTFANVRDSDGTIRMAYNFDSPGERCTSNAGFHYDKPMFDVDLRNPPDPVRIRRWLVQWNIRTLNIAGNTENKAGTVFPAVASFLKKLFTLLGHEEV